METLRIMYTKTGYLRFLGHLELMKLFERVFRLNHLPLKFSEGFNPIPKLTFAAPLSVGLSTEGDVMEVQLTEAVPLLDVMKIQFPEGIEIKAARFVDAGPSLMSKVAFSKYRLTFSFEEAKEMTALNPKHRLGELLGAETLLYNKKTKRGGEKSINMLEQIRGVDWVSQSEGSFCIEATLQTGSQGSLNPQMFIDAFFENSIQPTSVEILRTALLYEGDEGALVNLFEL